MRVILLCDGHVGMAIGRWLIDRYRGDIASIVTVEKNDLTDLALQNGISTVVFTCEETLRRYLSSIAPTQLGILAWWPKLISRELINYPSLGFINTHPSFLPFNRGKHYNFWNLVESVPFGVTLHFVDDGIDSGDIIAQRRIPVGWEDNGKSLYDKAQTEMVSLFQMIYPEIRSGKIPRHPQNLAAGTLHYGHELERACLIGLEDCYSARELLNLLRARTFPGRPACRFIENEEIFEVTVNIRKINP